MVYNIRWLDTFVTSSQPIPAPKKVGHCASPALEQVESIMFHFSRSTWGAPIGANVQAQPNRFNHVIDPMFMISYSGLYSYDLWFSLYFRHSNIFQYIPIYWILVHFSSSPQYNYNDRWIGFHEQCITWMEVGKNHSIRSSLAPHSIISIGTMKIWFTLYCACGFQHTPSLRTRLQYIYICIMDIHRRENPRNRVGGWVPLSFFFL